MKLKDRWKKLPIWGKGLFIGMIFGLFKVPFFVLFGEKLGLPVIVYTIFSKVPDEALCNLLRLGIGESCGFFVIFYGFIYNPIFYGIIGGIIGFLYALFKNEK
ncbi:MAG TPA: hypothetical protein VJB94_04315 [Candidatus Nanoarchaeia archaeon]|nr:hypothetical protein [Candidatus Nanoarchaeia archaeon]